MRFIASFIAPIASSRSISSPPRYFSSSTSSVAAMASISSRVVPVEQRRASAGMSVSSYSPLRRAALEDVRLLVEEVDDAVEVGALADRDLDRDDLGGERAS